MDTAAAPIELDVFSDVICPWCWLGHARLSAAIEATGLGERVRLRWRAFQLDPRAGPEPADLAATIDARYGPGAFEHMTPRLVALGAEAGLDYRFDRALRVNTFDAHRLVQAAQVQPSTGEATTALMERLFRAYFSEGADVADHEVLAGLAAEAGVERAWATEMLTGDGGALQVLADREEAVQRGITGVPAVTWRGATVIPGAQDPETMALVLGRIDHRLRASR